ncbi:MAG: hypothetical protein GEV09_22240 [Pseudonocardiaceae bacterium]|nr:hypothetical protein [Pseudonocardiaceae bacterium]
MVASMTGSELDRVLAEERERFLSSGDTPTLVRPEISSSWRRCSSWSVPAQHIAPPYQPDLDTGSRLLRAATPVLDKVTERLGELGIVFILTDRDARIIHRWETDRWLVKRLDSVHATVGHIFAEDAVGTNGLGTAVELGRTARVDGREHYVEELTGFTCVGVPVVDPVSRQLHGVLDVSCRADRNNMLVTALAEQTARSIEARLAEDQSVLERALLEHFLSASRRSHTGIVVVSDRILMTNPQAARMLDGVSQPLVWDHVARAVNENGTVEDGLQLADGRTAHTRSAALRDGGEVIGAVMEICPESGQVPIARSPTTEALVGPTGLAGTDRGYLETCRDARRALVDRVVVLYGEPGTGKLALGRALHEELAHEKPDHGQLLVHDAAAAEIDGETSWLATVRQDLAGMPGTLVLPHVNLLSQQLTPSLSAVLGAAASRGWGCVATYTCGTAWDGMPLPDLDITQVRLPPLRDRISDLPQLVAAFAAPRRLAPEAVQLLMRLTWPGNIRELRSLVDRMLAAAPIGIPGVSDVPAEVRRAAPRRRLTRFERAEVHVILDALGETGGNKKDAARLLGISRSTLYRKLQAAGIDLDNTVY